MTPLTLDASVKTPPRTRPPGDGLPPRPPIDHGDGDGSPSPSRPLLDNVRLAMVFFLSAETMLFGAFVSGFFVLRLAAPQWPPPLQPRLPVLVTGLNTIVLLASSFAMVRALGDRGDHSRVMRGLALTGALGVIFLLVQGYEWIHLVGYGLTMTSGAYGASFYTLIGVHGLHVVGALVWLGVVIAGVRRGRLVEPPAAALRACGMYWHFVVALWPVLYVAVYLL